MRVVLVCVGWVRLLLRAREEILAVPANAAAATARARPKAAAAKPKAEIHVASRPVAAAFGGVWRHVMMPFWHASGLFIS